MVSRKRKASDPDCSGETSQKCEAPSVLEERKLVIPRAGSHITLKCLAEASSNAPGPGLFGVAGRLWPAGRLLAEVLAQPKALGPDWQQRLQDPLRCLEIGAGTALPSLCLSLLGHECVATDLPIALAVTRANVAANGLNVATAALALGDTSAAQRPMPTARSARSAASHFDLVLAADVCYDPVLYHPLLQTLRALQFDWLLIAVVQRADLGEETFENFCQDEEFPLRMLHTAMPPAAAGAAAHRVNIYEAKGEDLGSRGDARQKDNGRCISGLKISKGSGRK